ncbi:MAG: DUF1016 N-terminal domain-containing protein [Acidobacteriota bacterium]
MATKKTVKKNGQSLKPASASRKDKAEVMATRLLGDIRQLIDEARRQVAQAVNAGTVMLYWQIGSRIRSEILNFKRAEYGEEIVSTLSRQLTAAYGKGYTKENLFHMMRVAEGFSDEQIVYALSRQLSWTHFRRLAYIDDPLKREFYAEMCRIERWSTRALEKKIGGMLFERTAIAKTSRQRPSSSPSVSAGLVYLPALPDGRATAALISPP